jgi:hypothetical protein
VRVEHHDGVHAQLAAATGDLDVAVDGVLPRALARAVELAEVHRRHMGDLGGECELSHGELLICASGNCVRRRCWQADSTKQRPSSAMCVMVDAQVSRSSAVGAQ